VIFEEPKQLNTLLIVVDQCTADTLSFYGGQQCETPNLDRLANRGTVFDTAYTVCPVCSPARASLYTGVYPHKHGVLTNIYTPGCSVHELPDRETLLSRRLLQHNVACGYTGKWHLGYGDKSETTDFHEFQFHRKAVEWSESLLLEKSLPTTRGFIGDDFPGHGDGGHGYAQFKDYLKQEGLSFQLKESPQMCNGVGYRGEIISPDESTIEYYLVERAKSILSELKQNSTWHMSLNFWGPHAPYYAPTRYLDKYRKFSISEHLSFDQNNVNRPNIHKHNQTACAWEDFQQEIRHAYALMSYIDDQIGRLLDWMSEQRILENTMIIFTADHGDSLGRHGGMINKGLSMYEETCRIPLIICGPGVQMSRSEQPVSIVDVYSTILDLAGVPTELACRHGQSLMPLLRGDSSYKWPNSVVVQCAGIGTILCTQRMIKRDQYKYIYNVNGPDEFYDLEKDPSELNNLKISSQYQKVILQLREELIGWMQEKEDTDVLNGVKNMGWN